MGKEVMDAISLPEHLFLTLKEDVPSATRQVIGPPDGDLLNSEIRAIDVITTFDEDGPRIHTYWKPDEEDMACLQRGGVIQFSWMGDHLHPISSQVWGA